MRSQGFGTRVTAVADGVWATLACSVVSAGCVALGWAKSPDLSDPKNWASWAALLIVFGGIAFVGTGANGARLWLKKRRIGRAPGDRLTIILADLVGDDTSRGQKQNVRDSLERYLESSIHIIAYPQALAIAEGPFDAELSNTHAAAQKILEQKRGDLLIWGRVKSANVCPFGAHSARHPLPSP